ncbi:MAG: hypothetical protein O3C40_06565 [Planctomycetota bacterium]|nr:hypothetical protein [Planctomycetota bacterium]
MTEDQVAELIAKKKLKEQSLLLHPTLTGNQWRTLATLDFRAAIARYDAAVTRQRKLKEAAARESEALAKQKREAALRQKQAQEAAAQQARAAQEAARTAQQQRDDAVRAVERERYLSAVSDHRKKYKVVLADSAEEAEKTCNFMGFEGRELEQSFTDTFTYQQCCGPTSKRQFVLVFSQPLEVKTSA